MRWPLVMISKASFDNPITISVIDSEANILCMHNIQQLMLPFANIDSNGEEKSFQVNNILDYFVALALLCCAFVIIIQLRIIL